MVVSNRAIILDRAKLTASTTCPCVYWREDGRIGPGLRKMDRRGGEVIALRRRRLIVVVRSLIVQYVRCS